MPTLRDIPGPCYVVSDHHLGASTEEAERSFIHFLRFIEGRAGALVINGDLFDFWFEWRHVIPRAGFKVLAALAHLVESGTPVIWIGGNHDCWGGEVLSQDVRAEYMLGEWNGKIAGWTARIEHGDGLREVEDRRYRALRSVIRHPIAVMGMRLLHPDFGIWLATRSSSASRQHRSPDEGAGLRKIAHGVLTADGAPKLYILGHTHVASVETLGPGVYANAGAWSDGNSYLTVTAESVALCSYQAPDRERRIQVVERPA